MRLRHCHNYCVSCSGPVTDENNQCNSWKEEVELFFYCSQTKGNGIINSCHDDWLNIRYLHKDDEEDKMNKCYPCLKDSKIYKNEIKYDDCWQY